ncbi:MAG: hypothetical protein U5N26_08480 [Candidatus Marinimicrobia bacterium]|nr:hypothetical protein [Candidatus Neomarinimicrobiota bacterium]
MKNIVRILFIGVCMLVTVSPASQRYPQSLQKTTATVADYVHYTSVGQLGLTVTNFGLLGEGYNNPDQPSCMYKQYPDNIREQVEHMSYGGLWVGGIVNGEKRVSTAVVDGVFDYGSEGFEFTDNGDSVSERSSIPTSPVYSPHAVSHQDFMATFHDESNVVNHRPLHIQVDLESYTWNYSFTEAFVILNYHITNTGSSTIEDVYAGIWADASIGNMNYTSIYEPGGGWSWYDNLNAFDASVFDPVPDDDLPGIDRDIAYQYDADGDNGYAQSYVGFTCLGSEPVPRKYWDSHYNQWMWNTASNLAYPEYYLPLTNAERYHKLSHSVPRHPGEEGYTEDGYPSTSASWMLLIGSGPFGSAPAAPDSTSWELPPGASVDVAYAVVTARWANNNEEESTARRKLLRVNADWAQKAYNGEDNNGNGKLDEGEDQNGNGVLDRYILPAPPPSPRMHVVPERGKVTLYWNDMPESFEDPISREKDFEGYKIYARRKTSGLEEEWSLLATFDLDNEIGYNTGLDYVRIRDASGEPSCEIFGQDTFHYKFENRNLLNGWPDKNIFSVTSYDRGDPGTGLESLESSKLENRTPVITGRQAADADSLKVGVYPNPYRVNALWDGSGVRDRMIWFTGLPEEATIRVFTLSGELIKTIEHQGSTYNGGGTRRLQEGLSADAVYAGGEHAWDLITDHDQALATGMYLFAVETKRPAT